VKLQKLDIFKGYKRYDTIHKDSPYMSGAHCSVVCWAMLQAGRPRVRFSMTSLSFSIDLILPWHYDPGVDSASNRNEYQESSWG
jgi:hypothetical protein